jgi:Rieske 2Fe-2S family protein
LIVVRGNDGRLRAFFNFCRHRGATVVDEQEPCGRLVRFQCPYHAWIYDLEGRLRTPRHTGTLVGFDPADYGLIPAALATWQGFVFVNLDGQAPPLSEHFGNMPGFFARFDLAALRRGEKIEYDVRANWKAIVENFSECYHCPGVHPQLNKITPYDLGGWLPSTGPWNGSWMEVVGDYETLSLDGATNGRPEVPGFTADDRKRVYYFVVWPHLLMSLHPDYLMTHQVWPLAPDRTRVVCEWFFHPEAVAEPGFDPSDAVGFWDLTNRQDWAVCEMQQRGTASRAYTPGRYSAIETGVHVFDLMVADRYAEDGVLSRFERERRKPGTLAREARAQAANDEAVSGNGALREVPER